MAYGSNLVRLIYLVTFLVEGAALWALFRSGVYRRMPWVTAFLVHVMTRHLLVYPLYEFAEPRLFFRISWILEIGATILMTALLIEIFSQALAEYPAAKSIGKSVLLISAIVLLLISVLTAPYGATHSVLIVKFIMVTERSVRIVH